MYRPEKLEANRIFGLDLSKTSFAGCVLWKSEGYVKHHRIEGKMDPEGRIAFISQLNEDDLVAIEGGTSSSNFAREMMEYSLAQVYVLNPSKLFTVFKSVCKTDKKDAVKIAHYIRDTHPSAWCLIPIPTREESSARSLVKTAIFLKQERTRLINAMHAVFTQNGFPTLKKSDLSTSLKRFKCIENSFVYGSAQWIQANAFNASIDSIEKLYDETEESIRVDIILAHPDWALSWLSIPGVGMLTAAACIAFLWDCQRFSKPAQLRNYVGLVPYLSQSGKVCNIGGVVSFGCMPVRRNIIQAAWAVRNNLVPNRLTDLWNDYVARGKKNQCSAVAIANKMLTIGWTLVRNRELFAGASDRSYLKRKLAYYKLTAIDPDMFEHTDDGCTEE